MFIHPITICLMLLSILNDIGINKMTSTIVEAFAVKHPSNQAFANEGLRTSCPWAMTRTQLEYANDVKKYSDYADDNDEDEIRWKKINYQIKSSIANEQLRHQRNQLQSQLIEKTNNHWPDYNFKRRNSNDKHVHLYELLSEANRKNTFTFHRGSDKKFTANYITREIFMTSDSPVNHNNTRNIGKVSNSINQSPLIWISHNRKTRETHSHDTIPRAKLTSEILLDDSIKMIPTAKVGRVLSKLFQQSLQQDESLANIPEENFMSNVKINSQNLQELDSGKSNIGHDKLTVLPQLQSKEIKFYVDKLTKINIPPVIKFNTQSSDVSLKSHTDKLISGDQIKINKFTDSIKTINPTSIHNFYRVFNMMPIFGLNFRSIQPREFVLAPIKFVNDIKILPAHFQFIQLDQRENAKGATSMGNNMELHVNNEVIIENNKLKIPETFNPMSNVKSRKNVTSHFIPNVSNILQDTHALYNHSKIYESHGRQDSFGKIKPDNTSISFLKHNQIITSMINSHRINEKVQLGHSPLNYQSRYAEKYNFDYRVIDEKTRNYYGHCESRSEGVTNGQYHVLLPDGKIQEVKYRVDKSSGYRANVTYHNQVYG